MEINRNRVYLQAIIILIILIAITLFAIVKLTESGRTYREAKVASPGDY